MIVSQLVVILKDTALGGVMLNFTELLSARKTLAAFYANVIPSFVVVGLIYIVLNLALTTFASWLERRLRRSKRGTGTVLGAEDVEELNAAELGSVVGAWLPGSVVPPTMSARGDDRSPYVNEARRGTGGPRRAFPRWL